MVVADQPRAVGDQEVAGLVHRRLPAVDVEPCTQDRLVVQLAGVRCAGADRVDVCARGQPGAREHRLARGRRRADEVRTLNSLARGVHRLDGEAVPLRFALGEGLAAGARRAEDPHAPHVAHRAHGLEVRACLDARPQDAELVRVLARQEARCETTDGGRADGGDLAAVEDRERETVLGLEEQHDALVGVVGRAVVLGPDHHHLEPQDGRLVEAAGHHPEDAPPAAEKHRPTQRVLGAITRERGERLGHALDARLHVEQTTYLCLREDQRRHSRPKSAPR